MLKPPKDLRVYWNKVFLRAVALSLESKLASPYLFFSEIEHGAKEEEIEALQKKVQDPELIQIIPKIRTKGNRVAHDFNNAELPLLKESLKGFSVHGFNSKRKEIFVQLGAENILEK